MHFGKLGVGFGRLGSSGINRPTAPVLAMNPAWTSADTTPDFIIDIDDTVAAGDSIRLQIQIAGGDWSSLESDTTHVITAPEDAANEIDLALSALANADYEARANVTRSATSSWSNVVSFTISGSSTAGEAIGLLLSLTKAS